MFRKQHFGQRPRFGNQRGRRFNTRKSASIHPGKYVQSAVLNPTLNGTKVTRKFTDFPLDAQLQTNIARRGFTIPTPIQDQVIPHVLAGKDVVGIANTGTGKTGAFLIPLVNKLTANVGQKVLIIAPTRELAVQIRDELTALTLGTPIRSLLCIGGANMFRQLQELKMNPRVIVSTPGRLKDLVQRRTIHLPDFQTIVLDEVDRMVDIGFIQDIRFIVSLLPKTRQSLFFSATVSPQINTIMQAFLQNPVTISVKVAETAQTIEQDVIKIADKNEKIKKLEELLSQAEFQKVLIFGRTKWGVDKLSKQLEQRGFNVGAIHGNKSQNQRLRVLSQFKQNRLKVLVATDVAARGLDIDDISHVINFDEPDSYDDYVHRIGRTGRGTKRGKALTFVESANFRAI